jgi:hypothetical protein
VDVAGFEEAPEPSVERRQDGIFAKVNAARMLDAVG